MTGAISSSVTTGTWLAGNQGTAIINSTAADGFNMFVRMKSTNGVWTMGNYSKKFLLNWTNDSVITAGTNSASSSVTLLDESGNSSFPGTVTASAFSGNASSATKLATARTISLGGDLSGSASFDGSANITISASVTAMTNTEIDKLFA